MKVPFTYHTGHSTWPMHVTDKIHPTVAMPKTTTWQLLLLLHEFMVVTYRGKLQTNTGCYEGRTLQPGADPLGENSVVLDNRVLYWRMETFDPHALPAGVQTKQTLSRAVWQYIPKSLKCTNLHTGSSTSRHWPKTQLRWAPN